MHSDSYFFKKAYEEAIKAYNEDEVPVGAIIVLNDKIIAKAHNLKESSNLAINHAEIIAISKANKKLKSWHLDNCKMYVTLEPCTMCVGAIMQSRIKSVYYGAINYQDGAIKLLDNKEIETKYFDNFQYCSQILTDYFKTKRKK